jgi:hypothetical protein
MEVVRMKSDNEFQLQVLMMLLLQATLPLALGFGLGKQSAIRKGYSY